MLRFTGVLLMLLFSACASQEALQLEQARQMLDRSDFDGVVNLLQPLASSGSLQSADAYNILGVALVGKEKYDQAIGWFNQAIKLNNSSYKYFFNRGNAYLQLKQPADAIQDYDKALALDNTIYDVFLNRGIALSALNRHKEALAELNKAASMSRSDRNIYFNRGKVLMLLEDFNKAAEDLHYCLELSPDFAAAHFTLALAEIALNDNTPDKEACAHLRSAAELGMEEAQKMQEELCR